MKTYLQLQYNIWYSKYTIYTYEIWGFIKGKVKKVCKMRKKKSHKIF